jgi:hypothetical protein
VAEAGVFEDGLPEGWYDDPAKPDMQRWWTGTDWTDHVRYSDKVRLYAVAPQAIELAPVEAVRPTGWIAADTVEIPQLTLPQRYLEPATPVADTTFDDFYVPMRDFPAPRTAHVSVAAPRRSGRTGGVWLMVIAVVGIAAGVALWILIPR